MFNSDYLCFLAVFFSGYREEEHSKLSAELENLPNIASRKSYIQRITEITKNSRKQDADIDRILQETRQLQIESNSIQDRLHRTYTVVDETIFRYCLNPFDLRVSPRILYYQRQIWCLSSMLWNKWIYKKKKKNQSNELISTCVETRKFIKTSSYYASSGKEIKWMLM